MTDPNKRHEYEELLRNRLPDVLGSVNGTETNDAIERQLDSVASAEINNDFVQSVLKKTEALLSEKSEPKEFASSQMISRQLRSSDVESGSHSNSETTSRQSQYLKSGATKMKQSLQIHTARAKDNAQRGTSSVMVIMVGVVCVLTAIGVFKAADRPGNQFAQHKLDDEQKNESLSELIASTDNKRHFNHVAMRSRPVSTDLIRGRIGDVLETGPREKRRVTLPDGSVLFINSQTKVTVIANRRIKLHRGDVFVEVVPASLTPTKDKFVVATPHRSVTALGTKFAVTTQPRQTNVLVSQGKVQVDGLTKVVAAGQQVIATETPKPAKGSAMAFKLRAAPRVSNALLWTRDLIAAAEQPLIPLNKNAGGSIIVVDPQGQEMKLSLRKFHVDVHIEDGFARTTIDQTYFNHTFSRLEGTFRFPLPPDASLSRLAMYVNGRLMEGGMAERDHARNVFEEIRHTRRDPALLEWIDGSTFKMRVFPLEPRQEKRLLLSYTQRLANDYGRTVYRFPAGHSMQQVGDWSTRIQVKSGAHLEWSSSSHLLKSEKVKRDLILQGHLRHTALDKDLVVELAKDDATKNEELDDGESTQFSSALHEGYRYLMLRFRPDLKGKLVRPKRNWVFLFEASADRNPILSRVQLDVIQTILRNAEHTDTFSIVSAATKAMSFKKKPLACTIKNIRKATKFLEAQHLVGALDLENGLTECNKHRTENVENWLVHVGSAVPVLGERNEQRLVKKLPKTTRYVGVGVGKRWARPFMKSAASRTGGHFTQINPDEKVTWRAIELLSTLNAPRLMDIKVAVDVKPRPEAPTESPRNTPTTFLSFGDTIADGQEICAITRIARGQKLPKRISVTGYLGGEEQRWSKTVKVQDVVENIQHLPRTWARLEIDRLVASGAAAAKSEIISLSKTMYVMSPFTSLLVLETEAMYKQYGIDRGRKDHWALYPAPATIKVVRENGPVVWNLRSELERTLKIEVDEQSILQQRLKSEELKNSDVAQIHKLRTDIGGRDAKITKIRQQLAFLDKKAEPTPIEKAITSVVFRGASLPSRNYRPLFYGDELRWSGSRVQRNFDVDFQLNREFIGQSAKDYWAFYRIQAPTMFDPGTQVNQLSERTVPFFEQTTDLLRAKERRVLRRTTWPMHRFSIIVDPLTDVSSLYALDPSAMGGTLGVSGAIRQESTRLWNSQQLAIGQQLLGVQSADQQTLFGLNGPRNDSLFYTQWYAQDTDRDGFISDLAFGTQPALQNLRGNSNTVRLSAIRLQHSYNSLPNDLLNLPSLRYTERPNVQFFDDGRSVTQLPGILRLVPDPTGLNRHVYTRHGTVSPLTDYCSGLETTQADLLAIVSDAVDSTYKPRRGIVDAKARELIEQARNASWESVEVSSKSQRMKFQVVYNGAAQFRVDRTTSEGLRETMICDGQSLWHLYPELGLGTKRPFTRFHELDVQRLIPWHLPTVEQLRRGANVRLTKKNTIRVSPLKTTSQPTTNASKKTDDKAPENSEPVDRLNIVFEFEFNAAGRLIERRVLDVKADKLVARTRISKDGTVVYETFNGKPQSHEVRLVRSLKAKAPRLVPKTKGLVVLPMPFRSSNEVRRQIAIRRLANKGQDSNTEGAGDDPPPTTGIKKTSDNKKEELSAEDALQLATAYFGEHATGHFNTTIRHNFLEKGDHRIGLAVLLGATNPYSGPVTNATDEHQNSPLASFIAQYAVWRQDGNTKQEFVVPEDACEFLRNLATTHNIWSKWKSGRAIKDRNPQQIGVELADALEFIDECKNRDSAWQLISVITKTLSENTSARPEHFEQLIKSTNSFRKKGLNLAITPLLLKLRVKANQLPIALEELRLFIDQQVRVLGFIVNNADLRESFADALKNGKDAPEKDVEPGSGSQMEPWNSIFTSAAESLIKRDRHDSVLQFANFSWSRGDRELAETLFDMAVKGLSFEKQPQIVVLAIGYLSRSKDWKRAEEYFQQIPADSEILKKADVWRTASNIAAKSNQQNESLRRLERALDIEFTELPQNIPLKPLREKYTQLMESYAKLVKDLDLTDSTKVQELTKRIIRSIDRWRSVDPDVAGLSYLAADLFHSLGNKQLAWSYWTTPLAAQPRDSKLWRKLAEEMNNKDMIEQSFEAYSIAFQCEPTNPEILWHHAATLNARGRRAAGNELIKQIANGSWQPRFRPLQKRAKDAVE